MSTLKKPDLSDPKLRAKLAKGMGHNYYGEPAWPNDLLYIFPVVILGTIACVVGLAVLDPAMLGDKPIILPLPWNPNVHISNTQGGPNAFVYSNISYLCFTFYENINKFSNL